MRDWLKIFILFFIFGLLVFYNSLNNKFLMDDYYFLNNPVFSSSKFILLQWDPHGLPVQLTHYYRPMAHIVLDLCYDIFKANHWQYHLLNIFLFAFAASLIYVLVRKLSGDNNLAFLTSLIYLIHPINGILVNYISANVFVLQVICILSSVLLLYASLERKNDLALYCLSLLLSFLSLFWHENGIMTPFYLFSVILIFRKEPNKTKLIYMVPYFLIIIFYSFFRVFFIHLDEPILKEIGLFHMNIWGYGANLFHALSWYVMQLFCPLGIVMQWTAPALREHIFLGDLGLVMSILLFYLLFIIFAKERICQLALTWALIGFAPACLAVFMQPKEGVLIEPHWFIFSSIGLFILAAKIFLKIIGHMKRAGLLFLFIMILIWVSDSYAYNQLWSDQKSYALFWSQQASGTKLSYFYLAYALQREGAYKESENNYWKALNNDSSDSVIFENIGQIELREGHWKQAESNFQKALKITPLSSNIINDLARLYLIEGRKEKAKELCFKSLEIDNDDAEALFLLIEIYLEEKDTISVKKYADRVINTRNDSEILTRLGVLMGQNGSFNFALECYIKAIKIAPTYKDAYLNAGTLLANKGKYDEAIHIWKLGFKIFPADIRFRRNIDRAEGLKLNKGEGYVK